MAVRSPRGSAGEWAGGSASPPGALPAARPHPCLARRAFTLVEMLVSLAVLTLALSIVGVVFAVTAKTASQAAAYAEVHNYVRQFMQQIEEDLAYCDPTKSMLVLVGRTQAAALTQTDLETGRFHRVLIGNPYDVPPAYDPNYAPTVDANGNYSDPRADILMFFTNRPTASIAPPEGSVWVPDPAEDPYMQGFKMSPVLVVYGHAALAQPRWAGSRYEFPPASEFRHIEQMVNVNGSALSRVPANRWHLSRRATIIRPTTVDKLEFYNSSSNNEWDRISRCVGSAQALPQGYGRPYGDVAVLNLTELLARLQGWPATYTPYDLQDWDASLRSSIFSLLYANGIDQYHHVATVLEEVPTELRSNLGVHMLPGCAWFQVEFLMPEDPRNSVFYSCPDSSGYPVRSDMQLWTMVNPYGGPLGGPATYVFVPDTGFNREMLARDVAPDGRPGPYLSRFAQLDLSKAPDEDAVQNRVLRLWPYAIRVTVRVYDPRGRLSEPIVRSVVHRFE